MNDDRGVDAIPGWGVDLDEEQRPGVPMEQWPSAATGAHWVEPEMQEPVVGVTHRVELQGLTPVFSSALPPQGLSGAVRRLAYEIPEHKARHWMLLMAADRIDVLEHRFPFTYRMWTLAAGVVGVGALLALRGARSR